MALKTTQCPHCFTTYVISDEQLRVSEGMVRCGSCRERFYARIIDPNKQVKPKLDPKEVFIEPLTEEVEAERIIAEKRAKEEKEARKLEAIREKARKEEEARQAQIEKERAASVSNQESHSIDYKFDSNVLSVNELLQNIKAKEQRDKISAEKNAAFEAAASTVDFNQLAIDKANKKEQEEFKNSIELIGYEPKGNKEDEVESEKKGNNNQNKEDLIQQVDSLVEDKLVIKADRLINHTPNNVDLVAEPFHLDRNQRTKTSHGSLLWSLILSLPLLLLLITLLITLIYQLWSRQIIVLDTKSPLQSSIQDKVTELSKPVLTTLSKLDVALPIRRDLSQLELASARTETHPNKEKTTLLRVSIINHASIEQPLPWLEMSLTDSEGKLVSRRSLSPEDYVYKNAINHLIGARELKKITIELLAFPQNATGYELKIVDR